MMLNWLRLSRSLAFLVATMLVLATACSTPSSGMRQVAIPFTLDSTTSILAVKVTPPSSGMEPTLLNEILGATIAALRETRKFRRVVSADNNVGSAIDLVLEINIVAAKEVSNALRGAGGAVAMFAGHGSLMADARVLRPETGSIVARATVNATTSGGVANVASGTNSEAVDRFAEQIVAFMSGR